MLFASLIRDGCRVKLRFAPEGKRFFVQFAKDILDCRVPPPADEELEDSELDKMETRDGTKFVRK